MAAAFDTHDEDVLQNLARRMASDPWLVFDALVGTDHPKAASAFAKAATGPHAAGLSAYAHAHPPSSSDAEVRTRLERAEQARAARRGTRALKALGQPGAAPNTILGVRSAFLRGTLLSEAREHERAAAVFLRAAAGAARIGWKTRRSESLYEAGLAQFRRSDFRAALRVFRERLTVEQALASKVGEGRVLYGIALCTRTLGHGEEALAQYERAAQLSAEGKDGLYVAKGLVAQGLAAFHDGAIRKALGCYGAAATALRQIDATTVSARFRPTRERISGELVTALTNQASLSAKMQDTKAARTYAKEALLAARATKSPRLISSATAQVARIEGATYDVGGQPIQALSQYAQAERLYRRLGDRGEQAEVLGRLARIRGRLGDHVLAHQLAEKAVAIQEQTGAKRDLIEALLTLSSAAKQLSQLDAAESAAARALALAREARDPALQISALSMLAGAMRWRGEPGRAFHLWNQALAIHRAHPTRTAPSHIYLGLSSAYASLGDLDRALDLLEASERAREQSGSLYDKRDLQQWRATLLRRLGHHEDAEAILSQLLTHYQGNGNRLKHAVIYSEMGMLLIAQGKYTDGAIAYERAIGLFVTIGHPGSEIWARVSRANALLWDKRYQLALVESESVHEQAQEYGRPSLEAAACAQLAEVHYWLEDYDETIRYARRGAVIAATVALDRSEGERAILRQQAFGSVARWGLDAAVKLKDVQLIHEFMERSSSTSLVASLSGREALRAATVPARLRTRLTAAQSAAARAYQSFAEARQDGTSLPIVRTKRRDLEEARALQWDAVAAIQRARRQQAHLASPPPAALSEVRLALPENAALIEYGFTGRGLIALVITRKGTAYRVLGTYGEARDTIQAVCDDPADKEKAAAARRLLLDPLKLDAKIKALLIVPSEKIAYVPFAVVDPTRDVSMLPSSTAWLLLRTTRVARGEMILAIGDPSYGGRPAPSAAASELLRGGVLTALPQTRIEAKAIGNQTLLGLDASETRFREVAGSRAHWRAIHIACHGLVDARLPTRSALVLTHDANNDGYLHASEVIAELAFSADLVVLSACETGRGRVFDSEGLVGLSRAFMLAGTPRVIASLWKVDDVATQALMRKFYELWNPKTTAGVSAARALKAAQDHIKSQKQWRDPHYWAAWVLWGLPD